MYGIGEGRDGGTARCRDIGACEGSMVATRARWQVGSSLIWGSDASIRIESEEKNLLGVKTGGGVLEHPHESLRFSSSSSATLRSR
jgi:hypothetical protein